MSFGTGPRLEPIPVDRWSDDALLEFRKYAKDRADAMLAGPPESQPMANVLATLMHSPGIAGPWLRYNQALMTRSSLEARLREIMIMRVAWRTRSEYEWLQHVKLAARIGIGRDVVDAIAGIDDAYSFAPLEALLLSAVDEMLDTYRVSAPTWAGLAEHLDDAQLLEALFIVGTYTCLSMAFNSFQLQLDPDLYEVSAPRMAVATTDKE